MKRSVLVLSLIGLVSIGSGPAMAQVLSGAALFDPATPATEISPGPAASPEVVRRRAVEIAPGLVTESADRWLKSPGGQQESFFLSLFSDVEVSAVLETVELALPGFTSWVGRVEGVEGSSVVLVEGEGVVAGRVDLLDRRYLLGLDGEAGPVIEEIDPALLPPPAEPLVPPALGPSSSRAAASPASPAQSTVAGSGSGSTVIDVLFVYTAATRTWFGGEAQTVARIISATGFANRILRDSDVAVELRIAGVLETSYTESGSLYIDLPRLADKTDGFLDEVHAERDRTGADIVTLSVGYGDIGGLAYVMTGSSNHAFEAMAFNVTNRFGAQPHEIGHNLGCHHGDSTATQGAFPYSFAHIDPVGGFVTYMGGGPCPGCVPLARFSNPLQTRGGRPLGTADRDNARSINNIREVVAGFRPSAPDACPWQPGHGRYCLDCGPCEAGEGDCDNDGQCQGTLVCREDVGSQYGFGPTVDVCESDCPWPPGHGRYCLDCGPCVAGEGDCDGDAQCMSGLVCRDDAGPQYGFGPEVDVCESACPVPLGHADYCALCGPCAAGEGDCDVGECQAGLECSQDVGAVYGFPSSIDVCESEPVTVTLQPVADAWVGANWPSGNFGTGQELRVRFTANGSGRYSFLKFQLPSLGSEVLSAKLRLRTRSLPVEQAGFYHAEIGAWGETTITWSNWGDPSQATYLRGLQSLAPNTWYEVDVHEAVTGPGALTLGIASGSDLAGQDFSSRESQDPPVLEITYRP